MVKCLNADPTLKPQVILNELTHAFKRVCRGYPFTFYRKSDKVSLQVYLSYYHFQAFRDTRLTP